MQNRSFCVAGAALWGLLGVACLAAGAHVDPSGRLTTGGQVLLFHAATVLALFSMRDTLGRGGFHARALLMVGSGAFAADMAVRLMGVHVPMMAPLGGLMMMGGWLRLGAAALFPPKG
jgi:uncharacterized membrane protein YgdD (TMEM256/DUF423 family)